jgi:hypothetical protein
MKALKSGLALACWGVVQAIAIANPSYSVDWDVPASGAGSSSGGSFGVWDVVGQSDAGSLSGGTFSVSSGQLSQPGLAGLQTRIVSGGRRLFYNGSALDGGNFSVNGLDDAALATDKVALVSGQTASYANITSHPYGITGLMVDVEALPEDITASDIQVKAGNTQTPASWANAPTPTVAVRRGAGAGGSDRVTLTWASGAIQNQWVQATIKATPQSGLPSDDVFYFGSSIGDTGNSPTDFEVNASDVTATRLNVGIESVPVTSPYDISRDGLVNSTDVTLVRLNLSVVPSRALVRLVAP